MGPIEPDPLADGARGHIRSDIARIRPASSSVVCQILGIDEINSRLTWDMVDTDGTLELLCGNTIQNDSAISKPVRIGVVVKRARGGGVAVAAAASQQERSSRLEVENRSQGPASNEFVQDSSVVCECFSLPKRQIIGAIDIHGVPDV